MEYPVNPVKNPFGLLTIVSGGLGNKNIIRAFAAKNSCFVYRIDAASKKHRKPKVSAKGSSPHKFDFHLENS